MSDRHAIKVVICSSEGRYLAGRPGAWFFTDDFAQAKVFDYVADRIGEQLELLRRKQGIGWTAAPLDPRERYEICDVCGQRVMPIKTFFDGQQYLCPACRSKHEEEAHPKS